MFSEMTRRLGARPIITMAAALLSLGIALLGLAPAIYATQIMGPFLAHGRPAALVSLLVGLAIALVGEILLRAMRFRVLASLSVEADDELATAVLQRSSEADHVHGMILLETVFATYSAGRIAAFMDIPTAILYIAALWWISPSIGIGLCIAIIVAVLFDLAMGRINAIASAAGDLTRNKVMSAAPVDSKGSVLIDWLDSSVRTGQIASLREGTMSVSNSMVYSIVLTIGAIMVVNASVSPAVLFGAGLLGSRAAAVTLRIGGLLSALKRGQPAMAGLARILNAPISITENRPPLTVNQRSPLATAPH